jgi:hypothetical protein
LKELDSILNSLLQVKYTLPDNVDTKELTKELRDKLLQNYHVNLFYEKNNRDSVSLLALDIDAHANVANARQHLDNFFAKETTQKSTIWFSDYTQDETETQTLAALVRSDKEFFQFCENNFKATVYISDKNIELSAGQKNLKAVIAHVDKYLQQKKESIIVDEEQIDNPDWVNVLKDRAVLQELKSKFNAYVAIVAKKKAVQAQASIS